MINRAAPRGAPGATEFPAARDAWPPPGQPALPESESSGSLFAWAFTNSARMRAIKLTIERVAPTDATVLITGESGVGKELVARCLHHHSPRRPRPFVKVNCAALPAELLESELLGYERGAFTGAHRQKPGKFELANTGTIFLDEIGELPFPLQAKLLQVLQDREFSPLGGQRDIRVDVRVIAASNKDLRALVQRGDFRDDLFYRLNVMGIHVPPLRERREEIPVLAEYFLRKYATQYGRQVPGISASTMRVFMEYAWPGNVRELENCIKRIVVLESEGWVAQELTVRAAPVREAAPHGGPPVAAPAARRDRAPVWDQRLGLKEIARRAAEEAEGMALREVLEHVHWHRIRAARLLKVSYKTLLSKMKQHGLAALAALASADLARSLI